MIPIIYFGLYSLSCSETDVSRSRAARECIDEDKEDHEPRFPRCSVVPLRSYNLKQDSATCQAALDHSEIFDSPYAIELTIVCAVKQTCNTSKPTSAALGSITSPRGHLRYSLTSATGIMATTTTTTTTVDVQNAPRRNGRLIKPNVPPDDLEVSPDPKWRDFRLREVRPELCEPYPATFPDLSHILYRNDAIAANQYQQENIGSRPRHFTTRSIDDIRDYKPERLQFKTIEEIQARVARIKMQTHPRRLERPEDNDSLPPFFYEETCSSLFSRVWDFANDTFGHKCFAGQLQDKDWTLHLLRNLPADFVRCASVVARGDPARGAKALTDEHGYEFMFLSKHQRVYLCTAVVSKLLQENCFDSLLFGTTKLERKTLNLIDRTTDNFSDGMFPSLSRITRNCLLTWCKKGTIVNSTDAALLQAT